MAKVRLLDPNDSKRRLDRYELIGELASGGMATVFLGRLGRRGRLPALRSPSSACTRSSPRTSSSRCSSTRRGSPRASTTPTWCPSLDVVESDDELFLVMEYVEGEALSALMRARSPRGARPAARRSPHRRRRAAGLHAAHEAAGPSGEPLNIVHRDVSPQNMLVGSRRRLARAPTSASPRPPAAARTHAPAASRASSRTCRPSRSAPSALDRRADVYAAGVVLWEVLAAKRLFLGDSEAITLQKMTIEPIPRLAAFVPDLHPALEQVVEQALERDPNRRYRTAADMAEALERAARAAANASATDLGVASPREVAAYVQGALGEDIAAQRESVRAWLAHSEPNMPRVSGVRPGESRRFGPAPGHDVTMKMPLDRAVALASRSLPMSAPIPPQKPASTPPPVSVTFPSAQAQPNVREALGISRHQDARVGSSPDLHPDGAAIDEEPVEPTADDDDEHETLLIDRDAAVAELVRRKLIQPARAQPARAEPTPARRARRAQPLRRRRDASAQIEAYPRAGAAAPQPHAAAGGAGGGRLHRRRGHRRVVAARVGADNAVDHLGSGQHRPGRAAVGARAGEAADRAGEDRAAPVAVPPVAVGVDAGVVRLKGPMPKSKATATPTSAPVAPPPPEPVKPLAEPPKPPPEPKAPDDMDNPYKKP